MNRPVITFCLFILLAYGCAVKQKPNTADVARPQDSLKPEPELMLPEVSEGNDLSLACLELAKGYFNVRINKTQRMLDAVVEQIKRETKNVTEPSSVVNAINTYLYEKLGFRETPDLAHPDFLLPDRVIGQRKGHCAGLSIVYLTLASRLQLPIYAMCVPDHMFLHYAEGDTVINIETTMNGQNRPDCYYRDFLADRDAAPPNAYLRRLTRREVLGLFLLDLGLCLVTESREADAEKVWHQALAYFPEHPGITANLGRLYFQRKQMELARKMAKDSIKLDPYCFMTQRMLGDIHSIDEHFPEAIEAYLTVIRLIEKRIRLYPCDSKLNLSASLDQVPDVNLSPQEIEQLKAKPDSVVQILKLGIGAYYKQQYELANSLFDCVQQRSDPNITYLHLFQAAAYFRRGMYEQALSHSRAADRIAGPAGHPRKFTELMQTLSRCYHNVGVWYFRTGDPDNAIVSLKKTLSLGNQDPSAFFALGLCYLGGKADAENAIYYFNEVLKREPEYKNIHRALAEAKALAESKNSSGSAEKMR